ncbi:MAG: TlpA family protein disulfide reductase [Bacteriovoracaceae bacterium]
MKKFLPITLFIMAFFGFLATQIIWDTFHLNAEQVQVEKEKYSLYENLFQEISVTSSKGTTYVLKDLKSPVVLVNFWASWCVPCLKEFPSLVEFQQKYKGKVTVIGINGDEEDPKMNVDKTEKKYKLNFESVLDPASVVSNKFMINTYPVSILYYKGKVIYVNKKIHDFMDKEFLAMIDKQISL